MVRNKQYYFVSKMKLEEKEREKHNLEVMKSNEDFYRQHIVSKKDDDNQLVNINKVVNDNEVEQGNKPTKNKKIKELQSFLGYKNKTAFCVAHNYQLFKLNACIDKLNNDKKEINEENIASYMNGMDNRLNKIKPFSTNLIDDEKIQKETQEEINKMLDSDNVKIDNIVIELEQLKKEIRKNRNRIKGLDWYFEKQLTKLRNSSECSLDTKINFVQSRYVEGIYRILALGLLYILINDIIISILRLIK